MNIFGGQVATPPSEYTRMLFRLVSDGEWHRYEDIRNTIANMIPPGPALRKYEERVDYKRRYSGDPDYDTEATENERIWLGARAIAQITVTNWKGRGIEYQTRNKNERWIRLKPGFTSYGLSAEGIPQPGSGDSEPSEGVPRGAEGVSGPESEPEPEPEPVPESAVAGAVHPSHKAVVINKRTLATTCPTCEELVIPAGLYSSATTLAGRLPCRGAVRATDPVVEDAIARADQILIGQGLQIAPASAEDVAQDWAPLEASDASWRPQRRGEEPVQDEVRSTLADSPPPSPTVSDQPEVTDRVEPEKWEPPLPDAEPPAQDAEMALFRESDMRHLIQEEVGKALDTFQVGMEQYLGEQFDQLSSQIALLRAKRGAWVFHPHKD